MKMIVYDDEDDSSNSSDSDTNMNSWNNIYYSRFPTLFIDYPEIYLTFLVQGCVKTIHFV